MSTIKHDDKNATLTLKPPILKKVLLYLSRLK